MSDANPHRRSEANQHRRLERFDLQVPASIQVGEGTNSQLHELVTKDLCAGGAFLHTDQPLPLGTEVKVELVLPLDKLRELTGKRALLKVKGAVIRTTESGMAICFESEYDLKSLAD